MIKTAARQFGRAEERTQSVGWNAKRMPLCKRVELAYNLAGFREFHNGSGTEGEQDKKMAEFVTVAKVGDIPNGQGRAYVVHDQIVAVFHLDGQYHAINDLCPHQGASLAEGHVENQMVSCPWHGWRFRVTDGTWCDNPRIKTDSYPVRVVDGQIQVAVEEDS